MCSGRLVARYFALMLDVYCRPGQREMVRTGSHYILLHWISSVLWIDIQMTVSLLHLITIFKKKLYCYFFGQK